MISHGKSNSCSLLCARLLSPPSLTDEFLLIADADVDLVRTRRNEKHLFTHRTPLFQFRIDILLKQLLDERGGEENSFSIKIKQKGKDTEREFALRSKRGEDAPAAPLHLEDNGKPNNKRNVYLWTSFRWAAERSASVFVPSFRFLRRPFGDDVKQ